MGQQGVPWIHPTGGWRPGCGRQEMDRDCVTGWGGFNIATVLVIMYAYVHCSDCNPSDEYGGTGRESW